MSRTIADIRNSTASLFDNPKGVLEEGLWPKTGQAKAMTKGDKISIEGGWSGAGAAYGYVLERGPLTKRTWVISPGRSIVLKGKRKGLPTIALRFVWKGELVHFRHVKRRWTRSQLRPHWWPALERQESSMLADYKETIQDAFEAEGLTA
jgi:hypothetical protein